MCGPLLTTFASFTLSSWSWMPLLVPGIEVEQPAGAYVIDTSIFKAFS
jgi:hypothetical protein